MMGPVKFDLISGCCNISTHVVPALPLPAVASPAVVRGTLDALFCGPSWSGTYQLLSLLVRKVSLRTSLPQL